MNPFKSSFVRLFTTGFVAGAAALLALQPAATAEMLGARFHQSATR